MTRLGALLAVAIGVLAVYAAGCGEEGDSTDSGRAPSRADFIKMANAACKRERVAGAKERADFFENRDIDGKLTPKEYAELAHFVLLPTIEREIWRIEELIVEWPQSQREPVTDMLSAQRIALDIVATQDRLSSIAAMKRKFAESDRELRAYGLASCANGVGPQGQVS